MQKKFAFYIFGMTSMQDLIPLFLESISKGHNVWFCMFDCVHKKRQFFYYEKEELINFITKVCKKNNFKIPKIDFYGIEDELIYQSDYNKEVPDIVFLQGCNHKYPAWIPAARQSKIINFAFHWEITEDKSKYHIDLNIVSKKEYIDLYRNFNFKTKYFGDIKLDALRYLNNPVKNFSLPNDRKVCFIAGTHLRFNSNGEVIMGASKTYKGLTSQGRDSKNNFNVIKFTNKMLKFLKENNFYIIWKEREKGYPKGKKHGWDNVLNYTLEQPDHVIKKDINFPSSLLYLPVVANVTIVLNYSTVIDPISLITNNVINIDTNCDFNAQMKNLIEVSNKKNSYFSDKKSTAKKIIEWVQKM